MKNNIIKYLFAIIILSMAFSCETYDYNDKNLDGFDPNPPIEDVQIVELTLADAEYKALASNLTNKDKAEQDGVEDALESVGKQFYFTDVITPADYLPAFLAANYNNYLSNGSSVNVTYKKAVNAAPEVSELAAADTYELEAADYARAWGAESTTAYFTPNQPASKYMKAILNGAIENPEKDQYTVASYQYSSSEPSTGGGDVTPPEVITDISAIEKDTEVTIQGTVSATYTRGFILADETGSVLVFNYETPSFSLGDVVKVKANISEYNNGLQVNLSKGNDDAVLTFMGKGVFAYPASTEMTGAQLDAYCTSPEIKNVTYTGELVVDGTYYNVNVEGAAVAKMSLSAPVVGFIDPALHGEQVTVCGYLFQVSSGDNKYVQTIVTSVIKVGEVAEFTPIGIVASQTEAGTYKIKGTVIANDAKSIFVYDGTGYILIYNPEAVTTAPIGSTVTVDGTTNSYAGLMQYGSSAVVTKTTDAAVEVKHPIAMEIGGAFMDAAIETATAKYVTYTGKLNIDGTYYNVAIADANTIASASLTNPVGIDADLHGKDVTVTGYSIGVAGGGSKYFNTMITSVVEASAAASAASRAVNTVTRLDVYKYSGSAWESNSNTTIVNPEDYQAMGLYNDFFDYDNKPETYLANFLKVELPYALAEDNVFIAYDFEYDEDLVELRAAQYMFDGEVWNLNDNVVIESGPYKKINGAWLYNPSQTITLIPGTGIAASSTFYQTGVDFVKENKGTVYISKYGTDENFSGFNAHYNNVNWKKSTVLKYGWSLEGSEFASRIGEFEDPTDMTDITLRKKRDQAFYDQCTINFAGTMSATLAVLYPDANAIAGIDIIYTVNVTLYTEYISNQIKVPTHTIQLIPVGLGQFEYVKDSFKALSPEFELMNEANYK